MRADPSSHAGSAEDGIALVTVLWFVALLSALALTLLGLGRDSALVSGNAARAVQTRVAMASAVEIAAQALWNSAMPASGMLDWRHGNLRVTVRALAENRLIDLNAASEELIEGLAASVLDDPRDALELAHAILDWRDPDGERRLAGAEAADYARQAGVARPRDGHFRFADELRSVRGVDEALFARLAPVVGVHHGEAEPEVFPLDPLVQQAVDRARGLLAQREGSERSFEDEPQSLDSEGMDNGATIDEAALPGVFVEDPAGLYTLDIELTYDDGPSFRQETVIWIDPPLGTGRHAILRNRSTVLPWTMRATGDEGDEGGVTWQAP